jgi:hypothetical protein
MKNSNLIILGIILLNFTGNPLPAHAGGSLFPTQIGRTLDCVDYKRFDSCILFGQSKQKKSYKRQSMNPGYYKNLNSMPRQKMQKPARAIPDDRVR